MHSFGSARRRFAPLAVVMGLGVGVGAIVSACGGSSAVPDADAGFAEGGTDGAEPKDAAPTFGACPSIPDGVGVCAGQCGNGRADSCTVGQGPSTMTFAEECDGADLRSESCESKGYLGGPLRCSARCTVDAAGCNATRDGYTTTELAPNVRDLAVVATRGTSVAVAWSGGALSRASQLNVRLALVVDRRLVVSDVCFGSAAPIRMGLVATSEGYTLMTSESGGGTDVFRLDASAKMIGARHFPGLGLAELATRSADGGAGEGTLLVGQLPVAGMVHEVHWLRADLTDAYEPQKVEYEGASSPHALAFGDTILLVAQTRDSKLVFTRLLPDGTRTTRLEAGLPFTSGWLGRRGNTGLLTRFSGSSETTLEGFDDTGTSTGIVRTIPGLMFPPRELDLGGRKFAIGANQRAVPTTEDAGLSPRPPTTDVAAHAIDGDPETRQLLSGPGVTVLGSGAGGEIVVMAGGTLRLLTPK